MKGGIVGMGTVGRAAAMNSRLVLPAWLAGFAPVVAPAPAQAAPFEGARELVALSGAYERVGDRSGVYAGVRITRTFSTCSRCLVRGTAFEAPARRRPPGPSE